MAYNVDAYFLDDIDAPYLKIEDMVKGRITKAGDLGFPIPDYKLNYGEGVLTATQTYNDNEYSIVFDANKDIIYSDHYLDAVDIFHDNLPLDITGADTSPIVKSVSEKRESPTVHTEFNLKERNIDLYAYDGTVLVPLLVLNPIFCLVGEKDFAYNGKALFLSSALGFMGGSTTPYFSYSESEKNIERNKSTTEFMTNGLFWSLDTFYGRLEETNFSSFEQFAHYIGVYDELTSPMPVTFFAGVAELITKIDDIHSGMLEASPLAGNRWGNDNVDAEVKKSFFKTNDLWRGYRNINYGDIVGNLAIKRSEANLDGPGTFNYNGDTCFIRFDLFARLANSSVFLENHQVADATPSANTYNLFYNAFKDLKANHPEVKNIVIDESMNAGGDATTLIELAGFLMSTVTITIRNSITKEIFDYKYKVDTNYDGVYDDADLQAKDYKVYCLTSPASFSCGNLFPTILKQSGAGKIIGQTSGGGCCSILYMSSALGDVFTLSSPTCLGSKLDDGSFISNDAESPPIFI